MCDSLDDIIIAAHFFSDLSFLIALYAIVMIAKFCHCTKYKKVSSDGTAGDTPECNEVPKQEGNPAVEMCEVQASSFQEGYIYHKPSTKRVHPLGGHVPHNDEIEDSSSATELVIHGDIGKERLLFKFVPLPDHGHFGYIQHVESNHYVHQLLGNPDPDNDTPLILHPDKKNYALFMFNEDNDTIQHIGGKFWHPHLGSMNPEDDTRLVLYENYHECALFYFSDKDGKKISPYSLPKLSGEWIFVTLERNQLKVGKIFKTKAKFQGIPDDYAWRVSSEYAKQVFGESSEDFVQLANNASEYTWGDERSVDVNDHSYKQQFVFKMTRYEDELIFKSDIVTRSQSENPKLSETHSII